MLAFGAGAVITPILAAIAGGSVPAGGRGVVFGLLAVWGVEVPGLWRWEVVIPRTWRWRANVVDDDDNNNNNNSSSSGAAAAAAAKKKGETNKKDWTLTLTDKSPTYLLSLQLALTSPPASLLPCVIGYLVGLAWSAHLLPWRMSAWRVPSWMVGDALVPILAPWWWWCWGGDKRADGRGNLERERYEGLRRRLEEEGGLGRDGDADGMRQVAHGATATGQGGAGRRRRPMGAQIADYFRGVF